MEENEESEELSEVEEKHHDKPREKHLSRTLTKNIFLKKTSTNKSFTLLRTLSILTKDMTSDDPEIEELSMSLQTPAQVSDKLKDMAHRKKELCKNRTLLCIQ